MTVYSYPIAAALDSTGATTVLKLPPGGIPAGCLICVFTYGTMTGSGSAIGGTISGVVADTPGNTYKWVNGQNDFNFWYTYNSKALRPGDTISVRKSGPMLVKACAFSGLVTTQEPLRFTTLYGGFATRPVAPVPAGDLIVMAVNLDAFGPTSLYVEDAAHAWDQYSFPRFVTDPEVFVSPIFATSLVPRPAGSFNWSPQNIPQQGAWLIIAASFAAAATVAMTAVGIAVTPLHLASPAFSIFGKVVPIGITVGSPFIEAPATGIDAPQVVCLTYRYEPDIMEALHTNYNVAFGLELQPHSLVGRSEPDIGMAQRITVVPPLFLIDKTLVLDTAVLGDSLDAIYARLAAVEAEAEAATVGLANLTEIVVALSDIVGTLVDQVAVLQTQVKLLGNFASLGQGGVDLVIARPNIGTPILT